MEAYSGKIGRRAEAEGERKTCSKDHKNFQKSTNFSVFGSELSDIWNKLIKFSQLIKSDKNF